jgi:2-polyprenyl-3-methyl-5-hydroxy-6-metoxy-1,4-benzoquinol methylase
VIDQSASRGMDRSVMEGEPRPRCLLCGREGPVRYPGLEDLFFGVPGQWNLRQCPDPDCGLLWLDPMPRASEIHKAYASYYTHAQPTPGQSLARRLTRAVGDGYLRVHYGYAQGVGSRWYRYLAPLVYLLPGGADTAKADVMFLPAPPRGARILDIGCGSGERLIRMQALGWAVEGLDADPRAVEQARAKGLTVRLGSLVPEQFAPVSFDAIYLNHVIEHVHDPLELIAQAFTLLKPGGALIVITPNSQSWGHHHFGRDWRGLEPPRHLFVFSSANVSRLARDLTDAAISVRTTARGAHYFSATSQVLRASREARGRRPRSHHIRTEARALGHQWLQRTLRLARPDSGDEVVMAIQKGAGE